MAIKNYPRILIIEDSEEIIEAVTLGIQIRWPSSVIGSTARGCIGLQMISDKKPDLVILDLGLEDTSGFEVLKQRRLFSKVPVIILTVRREESDIVKGLELGADDYIIKPFRQLELTARINALIRRTDTVPLGTPITCGQLSLDSVNQIAQFKGRQIRLTPHETTILATLMLNAGITVTHNTFSDKIWGISYPEAPNSLKVHIRRLREKIETDPSHPEIITTITGVGYSLIKPN